jgi:predicted nuclease of predicted toxin-antitoxin system
MRFIVDMNLSPKWVGFLESSGIDAQHWSDIGPVNAGDPEIMAYAKVHSYYVLTSDLDFGAILAATGGDAPSVVQLRTNDCRVEMIGDLVVGAILKIKDQLLEGALVTIETAKLRVTSLPVGGGK